ncbi:hypothetical protein A9X05_09145 [Mycobacterium sp. E3298]|nr:hypothetical protein [Mycobacterium sp. E3298]OBG93859.1 hypothetical protein A9X05_09145 [Mycobacterium sp. E3298]
MNYNAYERETVLQCDDANKKWIVSTFQQTIQTKLKKIGAIPTKISNDGQYTYELDFSQVSFRAKKKQKVDAPKRTMSDDHKRKLQEGRKKKKSN